MNFYRNALTGITLSLAAAVAVHATNGLYLTGYGPEELGRGGANLAVSDRSLGLNSNPVKIRPGRFAAPRFVSSTHQT